MKLIVIFDKACFCEDINLGQLSIQPCKTKGRALRLQNSSVASSTNFSPAYPLYSSKEGFVKSNTEADPAIATKPSSQLPEGKKLRQELFFNFPYR